MPVVVGGTDTYTPYRIYIRSARLKTLMRLMGHTNIETTLKYYVDTDENAIAETAIFIDEIMSNDSFNFGVAV